MRYDKLVRDKIPELKKADGESPVTHIASGEELKTLLADKLNEEVREFLSDKWDLKELTDIVEVCYKLAEVIGWSPEQLEFARRKKAERNGAFSQNIVLEGA